MSGDEQQTHSTGYTYLRLQTQPLTPKPCSTKLRGTGGLADLSPVERKKERRLRD